MVFTIGANGQVGGLTPVFGAPDDGPERLQGFTTAEGQYLPWDYDTRYGTIQNYLQTAAGPGSYYVHPTGKIEELTGPAAGNFYSGQQQAMAGNRWLLTTPGNGIGVQTAQQRSAPRWPGTTSPGRSPAERQANITFAQTGVRPQNQPKTPARAPAAARNPFRGGTTRISRTALQGLYPGPSKGTFTYSPAGSVADPGQFNYTPGAEGFDVAVPGVQAPMDQDQYSTDSGAIEPSVEDMVEAQQNYVSGRYSGMA